MLAVWAYQSNPFGEQQPTSSTGYVLNLRFPGQYYDQESGLSDNINRGYDRTIGRYLQSDPTGLDGGISTFAYVGGNPLDQIDLLGLSPSGSQCGGGILPNFLKSRAKSFGKDEIEKKCNETYKGDCGKLCECVYAAELVACGGPLSSGCIIGKAKPKAEMCSMTCPASGTFTKKEAEAAGSEP